MLETKRLLLLPFTHRLMCGMIEGRDTFERVAGRNAAKDWPNPDIVDAIPFFASALAASPELGEWMYLIVEKNTGLVVGELGFKGLPDAEGCAEVGYGICVSRRGRGYASESLRAIIDAAFAVPKFRIIRAECLPDNHPSWRVLQRCGFTEVSRDDTMIRWTLRRAALSR